MSAFALIGLTGGCGSGSGIEKVIVEGEVTYQGQPVAVGDIRFDPLPGTNGPLSGASIQDGRYIADGRGGVPVGEHLVRIRGFRVGGAEVDLLSPGKKTGNENEEYIPDIYNSRTETFVTIVGDDSRETHDFHLK